MSIGRGGGGCNNLKFYFLIGIVFNLCLLGFFKYTDFFLDNFNALSQLLNLDFDIPLPHILLPLALSFVTFQQIAFLYDCYKSGRNGEKIQLNFIDYALFISFFPQLIAGPIVHHREMIPQFKKLGESNSSLTQSLRELEKPSIDRRQALSQSAFSTQPTNLTQDIQIANDDFTTNTALKSAKSYESTSANTRILKECPANPVIASQSKAKHSSCHIDPLFCHIERSEISKTQKNSTFNYEFLAKGIFIFTIGLFKKVFIADSFAKWADLGFSGKTLNLIEGWVSSLSYTFQLYFDFSGYCDMAMGLGLMFGIVLPLNFNSPYKALNIADFWRRWHISLGRFLKECVYIPLGGNRVNRVFVLRNLFIVAILSGIWHGAGWGFVLWGLLHGVAMVIHRIYSWWLTSANSACSEGNSPSRSHSTDLANFEAVITNKVTPALKSAKNYESTSASRRLDERSEVPNARILKEYPANPAIASQFKAKHPTCHSEAKPKNLTKQSKFVKVYLNFTQTKLYKCLCLILTFNFINITWVFFRAENLSTALNVLKAMFGFGESLPEKWHRMPQSLAQLDGRNETIFYILIAFVLTLAFKNSFELMQNFRSKALKFSLSLRVWGRSFYFKGGGVFVKFIVSIGLFSVCVWILLQGFFTSNAYTPFLYFNF